MFHTIVSIKNDGHYFCRAGGNRPDGLNEPVTLVLISECLHGVRDCGCKILISCLARIILLYGVYTSK
ncbi:hypothetical protein D2U66_24760 [Escherichia coli]|nr:hypothetical protein [Escherichia coli]